MPTLRNGLGRIAAIVILVFYNANNRACLTKPSIGPKFIQNVCILDVEQPGYFLPTMHSAPRQPSRRVKQTTALHCQRLRIAFISPLFTLSYAKLFFIVCCTNNSVNGDDLAFFRIPNEASERERRGI